MKHDISQAIRRHPDGSIDTAYYLLRGRIARSKAAHNSVAHLRMGPGNLVKQLLARVSVYLATHRTSSS